MTFSDADFHLYDFEELKQLYIACFVPGFC